MNTILKGIIVEIKDDYIIALKNTGDMVRLKNKGCCEIGDSIMFFLEDIIEVKEKSNDKGKVIPFKRLIMPLATIAAICLIFFSNIANILLPTKGYAVVSMDINPSLQLELSDDERILKVKSLNKDAEKLFDGVKGMELKAGMEEIRDILLVNNYKLDNSDMLIGFTFINGNDNKDYEGRVQNTIKEVFKTSNLAYMKGTEEELKESEKKGVSLGRYEAEIDLDDLDLDDEDIGFIIEQLKKGNKINFLNEDILEDIEDELDNDSDEVDDNDLDNNSDSESDDGEKNDIEDDERDNNQVEENNDEQDDSSDKIEDNNDTEEDEVLENEDSVDSEDIRDDEENNDSSNNESIESDEAFDNNDSETSSNDLDDELEESDD